MLWAVLWAAATAEPVRVFPDAGEGPEDTLRSRQTLTVAWEGGPGRVERYVGGKWAALSKSATSPFTTPPMTLNTPIRVVRDGDTLGAAVVSGVWTPNDLSRWAEVDGAVGLRGAVVTGLATAGDDLWAATDGGGLGWWDGRRWRHLSRRDGLPSDHLSVVLIWDGRRVVGHDAGFTVLDEDGHPTTISLDGGAQQLVAEGRRLYALSDGAVYRWEQERLTTTIRGARCSALFSAPDGRALASCGGHAVWASTGQLADEWDVGADLVALVPRKGGAWLAGPTALYSLVDGAHRVWWEPLPEFTIQGLIQLGGTMLMPTTHTAGFRVTEQGVLSLRASDGVPVAHGLCAAPGPRTDKIWLGTTMGVALVNEAGKATPLPVSPLPAGVAVHGVAVTKDGVGVAAENGLVWLGPGRPDGWDVLSAAVGRPALAVVHDAEGGWWALRKDALFRWHDDQLFRFDTGARAFDAVAMGQGLAMATDQGLRFWLPGATLLSPADDIGAMTALGSTADGALWVAREHDVAASRSGIVNSWPIEGPQSLSIENGRVWVAARDGVFLIDPGADEPIPHAVPPGDLLAVGSGAGRVHALYADGRLVRMDPSGPVTTSLGPVTAPAEIHGDARGVWVSTGIGLFRVTPVEDVPTY